MHRWLALGSWLLLSPGRRRAPIHGNDSRSAHISQARKCERLNAPSRFPSLDSPVRYASQSVASALAAPLAAPLVAADALDSKRALLRSWDATLAELDNAATPPATAVAVLLSLALRIPWHVSDVFPDCGEG